jgi:ATP-binding cassette subfamily C protein LapB
MTRLISALLRLAFLQRQSLDKNALQSVLAELEASNDTLLAPKALLKLLKTKLRWTQLQELSEKTLDPSRLPCLIVRDHGDWRILKSFNSQSQWVLETDNTETVHTHLSAYRVFRINFQTPFEPSDSPVWKLIKSEIRQHQSQLIDAGISGVMLNVVALAISFYSMQIYDRVIPTNASATLWVLSLGVLAAIVFEWLSRSIRSNLNDVIVTHVDQRSGQAPTKCGQPHRAAQGLRKCPVVSHQFSGADADRRPICHPVFNHHRGDIWLAHPDPIGLSTHIHLDWTARTSRN